MGCDLTYDKDGNLVMAVCTRGHTMDQPCEVGNCNKRHDKLCDFPLGGRKLGETCDKKLCVNHAKRYEAGDLPDKIIERLSHDFDTFDLCPIHASMVDKMIAEEKDGLYREGKIEVGGKDVDGR